MRDCGKCGKPRTLYQVCAGCTDRMQAQLDEKDKLIDELQDFCIGLRYQSAFRSVAIGIAVTQFGRAIEQAEKSTVLLKESLAQRQRSLDARNESVNKQGVLLGRLERLDQLLPEAVRLMGKIDKSCHEPVPQKILDDPILGKGSCPTYRCGVCSECSANALAKIFATIAEAARGGPE